MNAASSRLRLYRNPLRQGFAASTWRGAWYLLAYQVMGWLLFSAALTAASVAAVLSITLAGIPLLVAAAGVIHGCAGAERSRLRGVLDEPVQNRYRQPDPAGLAIAPGLMARARASWKDPATWREFAYLVGMFVPLVILGCVVLAVWLTLAAGITMPLWYWAPAEHYPHGLAVHGVQLGYFPNGPSGSGAVGLYVDTPPEGAARRRRVPDLVRAVQLRPGADRTSPCPGRAGPAARAGRPPRGGQGPAPASRPAAFCFGPNGQWFWPRP